MSGRIGDLGGIPVRYSPLLPYGQAMIFPGPNGTRTIVLSTAPRPTRWARLKAWLRRKLRRGGGR